MGSKLYHIGFIVHAEDLDDTFDIKAIVDSLVDTVESDPRCEVLVTDSKTHKLKRYSKDEPWEGASRF